MQQYDSHLIVSRQVTAKPQPSPLGRMTAKVPTGAKGLMSQARFPLAAWRAGPFVGLHA
jgi:hypothetical protein